MRIYKNLSEVRELLRQGKGGVIPSDTVYGLVAAADNHDAVKKIYELKGRSKKPGTIIAASADQLARLGFKKRYLKAVEHFWPGAVSVVIPCFDLKHLHLGAGGVPVRIPGDKKLRDFLEEVGPLQTSSANLSGQPEATTVRQAQEYFGDNVDFYVDGGDLSGRIPSTVIRIVDDAIEVIREGAVKIDENGRI